VVRAAGGTISVGGEPIERAAGGDPTPWRRGRETRAITAPGFALDIPPICWREPCTESIA
jgi:hypothetical protein